MENSKPTILRGIVPYKGKGLGEFLSLGFKAWTTVRRGTRIAYLNVGHSGSEMIVVEAKGDFTGLHFHPIGPKGAMHVAYAPESTPATYAHFELKLAAPLGAEGVLVFDVGLVEPVDAPPPAKVG